MVQIFLLYYQKSSISFRAENFLFLLKFEYKIKVKMCNSLATIPG